MSIILPDNRMITQTCYVGLLLSRSGRYTVDLYTSHTTARRHYTTFGEVVEGRVKDTVVQLSLVLYDRVECGWCRGDKIVYDNTKRCWKAYGGAGYFNYPMTYDDIDRIQREHNIMLIRSEEIQKGVIFKRTVTEYRYTDASNATFYLVPAEEEIVDVYFTQPYQLQKYGFKY